MDSAFLTRDDAWKNLDVYNKIYEFAKQYPVEYWAAQIDRLSWEKKPNIFFEDNIWFKDGILNACYNCVDRHAEKNPDKIAVIWQSENLDVYEKISYEKLQKETAKFANVISKFELKRTDCITIYMPMVPEGIYACLACARLGIPYTVVFAGFSPNALALRMNDCNSKFIITCDANRRGGKIIPLKQNIDAARKMCNSDVRALIVKRQGVDIAWNDKLDFDYYKEAKTVTDKCSPVSVMSNDDLFLLYTSGSAGKPKGVVQGTGGFLLFSSITLKYFFDLHEESIFLCSGDIGWMGGHAYSLYAPLCNGVTTVIYEGIPTYPKYSVFAEIIDKYNITAFNTAPTALRAMMQHGKDSLSGTSRKSLKVIGVFGEVLNKDVWMWYFNEFGNKSTPIVNMWGQTELGGVPTAPLCTLDDMKTFGHTGRPFFGCKFVLKDKNGNNINEKEETGALCIEHSMPGMLKGIYGDPDGMHNMYYSQFPGLYYTGDEAYIDYDGFVWVTGRVDDVLNVSGHRVSPIEIEEVIAEVSVVHEVSVVGYPHPIKGDGLYAFIVLNKGVTDIENARKLIIEKVRDMISPITKPDVITFVEDLPKTRSGKIMRRILRKIAAGYTDEFEDITTIQNPECITKIIKASNVSGNC